MEFRTTAPLIIEGHIYCLVEVPEIQPDCHIVMSIFRNSSKTLSTTGSRLLDIADYAYRHCRCRIDLFRTMGRPLAAPGLRHRNEGGGGRHLGPADCLGARWAATWCAVGTPGSAQTALCSNNDSHPARLGGGYLHPAAALAAGAGIYRIRLGQADYRLHLCQEIRANPVDGHGVGHLQCGTATRRHVAAATADRPPEQTVRKYADPIPLHPLHRP